MADPNADDVAEELRREIAPLRDDLIAKPSDFGLEYLSVDALMARADAQESPSDRGAAARRFGWTMSVAVGLAAAAAVVAAVVLPRLSGDSHPPNATPGPSVTRTAEPSTYGSSRAVLLAAATVSGPTTKTPHYWHVKSVQTFGSETVPREVWIGRDRPTVLRQDGFVDEIPALTFPIGPRSAGWQALQALPTNPARLRSLLSQDDAAQGRDERWVVFKTAGDLLAEAPVPPGVRKALWRVLAAEHGARQTDRTSDEAGRMGWTVSMSVAGEGRVTYVVDPVSGQMLEARHVPEDGQPPWTVTYLERGPANTAPALKRA